MTDIFNNCLNSKWAPIYFITTLSCTTLITCYAIKNGYNLTYGPIQLTKA